MTLLIFSFLRSLAILTSELRISCACFDSETVLPFALGPVVAQPNSVITSCQFLAPFLSSAFREARRSFMIASALAS